MNRPRKLVLWAITCIPVLVLIVASAIYVRREVNALVRHANVIIAGELARQFKREVEVSSAQVGTLGKAVLRGVRVAKGKTLSTGEMVSAREVVVYYDWRALISGKGAGSISRVAVFDPNVLLIRRRDGTFNIADLLKRPPVPKRPPFVGRVRIVGGRVTFFDYAVQPARPTVPLHIRDLEATVDAARYPLYHFDAMARGRQGEFRTAHARGTYHSLTRRILVRVVASQVSAPRLTPYVLKSNKLQVSAGNVDTTASLDFRKAAGHYRVSVTGTGRIENAAVRADLLKRPVTSVSGTIWMSGNRARLDLSARFVGADVRASGFVANFVNPTLGVTLDSPSIDVRKLVASTTFLHALAGFEPSGRGPVHARVVGPVSNLTVDASARVPRASVRGVQVRSVNVSARYRPGMVEVKSLSAKTDGTTIYANGRILLRPAVILDVSGRFEGLDVRRVPIEMPYAVTGMASGSFRITGPTSRPIVSVAAHVTDGSVRGVAFGSLQGHLTISGPTARISDLTVSGVFQGVVRASGVVSGTAFDLRVSAESIDVGTLAGALGESGYGGTAFFDGRVFGNLKAPQVHGAIEVFGGRVEEYEVDHAVFRFSADRGSIAVSEGLFQVYPAELRFSGEAHDLNTNRVAFSGEAHVRRLEVTKLLDLLKRKLDVTGIVLGDFVFSGAYLPKARRQEGRFEDVTASGSLSLEDATAFGYPVTAASAKLDYVGDELRLTEAYAVSDGARLNASGSVNTAARTIDASFDLSGVHLTRLDEYFRDYLVLGGTLTASGRVSGPLDNARGTIDARVEALVVNYEKFDTATAHFDYDNGKFASFSVNIARAGQTLDLSGTGYDPEANCLTSANGVLTDISVPDVLAVVRASPYFSSEEGKPIADSLDELPRPNSGRINGTFTVSGCFESPEGKFVLPDGAVNLIATNVGMDVNSVETIELSASARSGVVSLDRFQVVSGEASITATGETAYENGEIDIQVKADNFDLAYLSRWLGPKTPLGTLSAVFDITGAASAPEIVGSLEIVKPSYKGFSFDRLRASSVQIMANRIEIPKVIVTAGAHQVQASASVPWEWSKHPIPNDEPISVSADISGQDLSVLSVLVPLVDAGKTTGTIDEGNFQLMGTLLDPQMSGALKVSGGTIALRNFTNTFTGVTADLAFTGDRVEVNTLSALSSDGGSMRVVPGGYVAVGILGASEMNLKIVADRLVVGEKNLLGYREDVHTQIDAGLSVIGPVASPTVADASVGDKRGGITLSHGKLAFVLVPKPENTMALALPIDATVQATLRLGDSVEVAPPGMSLVVTGGGRLTGRLSKPGMDLPLEIRSGEINLTTARLRVMPGGTIHIVYEYPNEPVVTVDFQSITSVFAINSLGQRDRYRITMRVTGQASKPQISLTSEPPGLTHAQMLAALGHVPGLFTSAEAGLESELASVLTAVGTTAILAPIENIFVQKLGFEQFSLEFSPAYPLSIYMSRHLLGGFYIAFYRQLTGSFAGVGTADTLYEVVLSYRFRHLYQMSVGANNQQTIIFQIGYGSAF